MENFVVPNASLMVYTQPQPFRGVVMITSLIGMHPLKLRFLLCMQPRALHNSSWGRFVKRMVFEVFFLVVFQVSHEVHCIQIMTCFAWVLHAAQQACMLGELPWVVAVAHVLSCHTCHLYIPCGATSSVPSRLLSPCDTLLR